MEYKKIVEGKFIERPNRFVANVWIEGNIEKVHVKNTGRCAELLREGTTVYLEDFRENMGSRKLAYSLVAVKKGEILINMDSQAPNKVVREALVSGVIQLENMGKLVKIEGEKTFGKSRLDFYVEDICGNCGYIEVKGVSLEENGVARFPDAPTERGIKHLRELEEARKKGFRGYIIFVIQMEEVRIFKPNDRTHYEFGNTLREISRQAGVEVLAYSCKVSTKTLDILKPVPVQL